MKCLAPTTLVALIVVTATTGLRAQQVVRQRGLEPVRYVLDMTVQYDPPMLRGSAQITVRNSASNPETVLPLLLYRLLTVRSARSADGGALPITQAVVSVEDFPRLQLNAASITLPRPLGPGDTTTVQVDYEGYLLGYAETGMGYVQDRIDTAFTIIRDDAFSYPTIGLPVMQSLQGRTAWRFSYVANVTVPGGLVVANGGQLLDHRTRDAVATYTYANRLPAWRLDLAIASFGTLEAGTTRVYYLPGDSAGAVGVLRALDGAMHLYTGWFGPLRTQPGYTVIEIPDGWGSQADRTAIMQTAGAFRDPRRWMEVYHEVSHLWNVEDRDPEPPRWNEGLATFLQYLTAERLEDRPIVAEQMGAILTKLERRFASRPEERAVPLIAYGRAGLTNLSYSSGALLFAVLHELLGGEQFNRIIGGFYQRYAATGATTEDFIRYAKSNSPVGLARFFDDWVYTSRWTQHLAPGATVETLAQAYRPQ